MCGAGGAGSVCVVLTVCDGGSVCGDSVYVAVIVCVVLDVAMWMWYWQRIC